MRDDYELHRHLLHRPGSRHELNTPVLVLERGAVERNITKMAEFAAAKGVRLRPHAKTHKSADIARLQLAAGAVGVCCAKLGEAEAFAAQGISNILITSPIVTAPAIRRLAQLNEKSAELVVVVDNSANVAALVSAVGRAKLHVLIDVDPGIHRTGVASPESALRLFQCIADTPNLVYRGIQYFCGLQQHIPTYHKRAAAVAQRTQYLKALIGLLAAHGGKPELVTGGGTGTHRIDAELGLFTEWQVGSYVFMDQQYAQCDLGGGPEQLFEHALFVDSSVVSANTPGIATVDAGFKALSTDGGSPKIISGAPPGAEFHFMGDEHGAIILPNTMYQWQNGDSVRLVVPHCDPTVNLYDAYHVVDGDTLVDIWPVTARGRCR